MPAETPRPSSHLEKGSVSPRKMAGYQPVPQLIQKNLPLTWFLWGSGIIWSRFCAADGWYRARVPLRIPFQGWALGCASNRGWAWLGRGHFWTGVHLAFPPQTSFMATRPWKFSFVGYFLVHPYFTNSKPIFRGGLTLGFEKFAVFQRLCSLYSELLPPTRVQIVLVAPKLNATLLLIKRTFSI